MLNNTIIDTPGLQVIFIHNKQSSSESVLILRSKLNYMQAKTIPLLENLLGIFFSLPIYQKVNK